LLTVDVDDITVNYPSPFELVKDLRGMGESNASVKRHGHLSPDTFAAAAATYQEMYGNDDGTIPATFQVIYLLGWKPDDSQVKAAPRGSATHSLADLSTGMSLDEIQSQIDAAKAEVEKNKQ
jgi:NADH dehydrogenase [ubiquinone] 1 alpha subcomplex assembly factor 5